MLFKCDLKNNELEPMAFYDYAEFEGREKDLENLLADNLAEIFVEDCMYMTIFQERRRQPEPDLCALDRDGNLILFELKLRSVSEDTTLQILRYAQDYGCRSFSKIEEMFQKYCRTGRSLRSAHAEAFDLDAPLDESAFNNHQKLIIVGNSADEPLIKAVDYWRAQGVDIDFLPYRFYKLGGGEIAFEFFAKPYDYHINPRDKKGIMFDTNESHRPGSIWKMFADSKVSAYGDAKRYAKSFSSGDYVLYYHAGAGVVGAGTVKGGVRAAGDDELYRNVDLITPAIKDASQMCSISPSELKGLLKKNFYFASTIKSPFLTVEESQTVIDALVGKYRSAGLM